MSVKAQSFDGDDLKKLFPNLDSPRFKIQSEEVKKRQSELKDFLGTNLNADQQDLSRAKSLEVFERIKEKISNPEVAKLMMTLSEASQLLDDSQSEEFIEKLKDIRVQVRAILNSDLGVEIKKGLKEFIDLVKAQLGENKAAEFTQQVQELANARRERQDNANIHPEIQGIIQDIADFIMPTLEDNSGIRSEVNSGKRPVAATWAILTFLLMLMRAWRPSV